MINMTNVIPAVETLMVVMTKKILKINGQRDILVDYDTCSFEGIDRSTEMSPVFVTVIGSG